MSGKAVSVNEQERIILSLRKSIPPVLCKVGCTDCCGAVPWSHWEWHQLPLSTRKLYVANEVLIKPPYRGALSRKVILPLPYKLKGESLILMWSRKSWMEFLTARPIKSNKCVFLSQDERGCMVYEHRPIICRLFATIVDSRAACRHGCTSIPQLNWALGISMTNGWFECMEKP